MIIEGKNSVYEALLAGTTFNKLVVQVGHHDELGENIITEAKERGIRISFSDKKLLDRLSESGRHQGFVAEVTEFVYSEVSDMKKLASDLGEQPFVVILDGIEDPHNLGSIIRTCECAGVHGIVIPKQRSALVNSTVLKVSAGAASHMKIAKVTNIHTEIEHLKKDGFWVYAAAMNGEVIYKTNCVGPIAIVIGNEGKGVSTLTRKLCDGLISLPQFGKINSLNAGSAASAIVYEIVRQRNFK
ncbi:MAG: 23S rRNA (guanosine(2251)-2'-O)-methyltransferase RlmB [Christensenellaceae bacterium]|jgi:23S rRNA (guanosine2251-2'-O)-methyltransferase|nr:23S rRNA (guanosine(2251)-2'-O)-methyltransferase RlmB [Christensenellaceae bacterium]